jgi:hypothetical protein
VITEISCIGGDYPEIEAGFIVRDVNLIEKRPTRDRQMAMTRNLFCGVPSLPTIR